MKRDRAVSGFTLIELAIVLVIIALMAGGIMLASSLIRDAEIRAAIAEYDRYAKAIREFQDKYAALPGDMSTATSNWGTGTCPNVNSNATPATPTCNGDGNGRIGTVTADGYLVNASSTTEWWLAWQHLSNSGLIDGKFNGAGSQTAYTTGKSVPASQLAGSGWLLFYYLNTTGATAFTWQEAYGHVLNLGSGINRTSLALWLTPPPLIFPTDAQALDTKIDDGKPGRGIVRAWRTALHTNCTTNDVTQDTAAYNITYQDAACSPMFILGF